MSCETSRASDGHIENHVSLFCSRRPRSSISHRTSVKRNLAKTCETSNGIYCCTSACVRFSPSKQYCFILLVRSIETCCNEIRVVADNVVMLLCCVYRENNRTADVNEILFTHVLYHCNLLYIYKHCIT